MVEVIGRWFDLDVCCVVARLIVSLACWKALAIHSCPGPGAMAFGAVVVLTIFAAMASDPRLILGSLEEERG
ncbi:MAG: paraquat-inducible protein A [Sulfuritalea sp.]|nr:paraquat-inducible protein A [Sulfuritalea sp.]